MIEIYPKTLCSSGATGIWTDKEKQYLLILEIKILVEDFVICKWSRRKSTYICYINKK